MTMLKQFISSIKKHPLVWFYGISVLIEIALIPLFVFTGNVSTILKALEKTGIPFKTDLITLFQVVIAVPEAFPGIFLAIVQVASVDIAVLIVAKLAFGQKGIVELKNRFGFWRRDIGWQYALKIWGICIITFSVISLAAAGLNKFMFSAFFIWDLNVYPIHFLVSLAIALFLDAGGLFEENGWRGFALPLLLQHFSPLNASLVLGFFGDYGIFPLSLISLKCTAFWGG